MFWTKPKYWIVRRCLVGVQIEFCKKPEIGILSQAIETILEGPLNTKEEAIEAFKFWTTNKHNFGGL